MTTHNDQNQANKDQRGGTDSDAGKKSGQQSQGGKGQAGQGQAGQGQGGQHQAESSRSGQQGANTPNKPGHSNDDDRMNNAGKSSDKTSHQK